MLRLKAYTNNPEMRQTRKTFHNWQLAAHKLRSQASSRMIMEWGLPRQAVAGSKAERQLDGRKVRSP